MNIGYQKQRLKNAGRVNFGGSKSQDTSSTNQNYDNRNVTTTTVNDLSNRTSNSNNTTASFDSSQTNSGNTTASFWDDHATSNSNNSSIAYTTIDSGTRVTNTTTLDGGAIAGMASVALAAGGNALDQVRQAFGLAAGVVGGANDATVHAYDYADGVFSGALDFVNKNDSRAMDAWDRASTMQEATVGALQGAYADAKGTSQSQQKIMLAVVTVAGLAMLAAMKRG